MAQVYPFTGIRYNPAVVGDPSSVICPPYDVISPAFQRELYERNKYNFVRIEHGRQLSRDTGRANKYTRSLATLRSWLKQGVLESAPHPAIYLHDHHFTLQGKSYRRRGIVVALALSEWDRGIVRPHEGTLANPKSDRLTLLRTLRANTSPILALFTGTASLSQMLEEATKKPPLLSSELLNGERHDIWAIEDEGKIAGIAGSLAPQPIYIADGHHRYESALAFRRETRAHSDVTGKEPFDSVMATLTDFADPGLIVLSPHRLLSGLSQSKLSGLAAGIHDLFAVEAMPLSLPGFWQRVDGALTDSESGRLAVFGLDRDRLWLLRCRDAKPIHSLMPSGHSEIYQRLDVSLIEHIILEGLLGLADEANLSYSYDREDAIDRVRHGQCQLALLLSPVMSTLIKAVADAGDRLPRKSTYFYPKAPAGLIFRLI
ncbi:MAG: DUF1015 domain-containing protein [Chloroflexota bacterium]